MSAVAVNPESHQAPPPTAVASPERMAEAMRRADLLRTAIDVSAMVAWWWDRECDRIDVEYRSSEPEAPRFDTWTMRDFLALVSDEDRARVARAVESAFGDHATHRFEFRARNASGELRWFATAIRRYDSPQGGAAGLVGTTQDITERRMLEREIIEVVSREQERIGHDLHDGLGQELTGIGLMLKALAGSLDQKAPESARDLERVLGLVTDAVRSTRSLAHGLSPLALDRGGLSGALKALVRRSQELYRLDIRLRVKAWPHEELDQAVAMHVYRIAQEALANTARHAGASRVQVTLNLTQERVNLRVLDNGAGLPESADQAGGMGFKIMTYRARMIGAAIDVRRRPHGGTAVVVSAPRWPRGRGTA